MSEQVRFLDTYLDNITFGRGNPRGITEDWCRWADENGVLNFHPAPSRTGKLLVRVKARTRPISGAEALLYLACCPPIQGSVMGAAGGPAEFLRRDVQ